MNQRTAEVYVTGSRVSCCGEERHCAFCPSCGKNLTKPNPLVIVRKDYEGKLRRANKLLQDEERRYTRHDLGEPEQAKHLQSIRTVREYRKKRDEMQDCLDAISAAIANTADAKMVSDWLEERGFLDAAKAFRGAFCP